MCLNQAKILNMIIINVHIFLKHNLLKITILNAKLRWRNRLNFINTEKKLSFIKCLFTKEKIS